MCHFHQKQIIRRYITKKPKLEANKELQEIVYWLCRTEKDGFYEDLTRWYERWKYFMNERYRDKDGRLRYSHRRTRAAYYSLVRHKKYLFTYESYLGTLDIPTTTNGIESVFSHLKYKVNLHR